MDMVNLFLDVPLLGLFLKEQENFSGPTPLICCVSHYGPSVRTFTTPLTRPTPDPSVRKVSSSPLRLPVGSKARRRDHHRSNTPSVLSRNRCPFRYRHRLSVEVPT